MNIKIDRKIYNTETALQVAETFQGAYGDSTGFQEILYKRGPGDYFLYGHGGEQSPYPQPALYILTIEDAKSWMTRIAGEAFTNTELGIVKGTTRKAAAKKAAPVETVEKKAPVAKTVKVETVKAAPVAKTVKVETVKAEKKAPIAKAPKAAAAKAPKAKK